MDIEGSSQPRLNPPSGKAVRRFWTAWLILLLAMLAGFIIVILIAAVAADPARVSPVG
jgi:hypothetical protein